MKAAAYVTNGPPSVLRTIELPDPLPGDADVLIRVHAISVEGGDLGARRMRPPTSPPQVPGFSAAGVVESVGPKVSRIHPGQRVAAFNWSGSHAELWTVPEHYVYPIPDSLGFDVAATVPVAFGTADDSLFEFGGLASGETVLIRGATGGVGLAAVQLAKAAGAQVIATSSSQDHARVLRELGADHVVLYKTEDIAQQALAVTGGAGVDLLVELAGGSGFHDTLAAMKHRARISLAGAASGQMPTLSFADLAGRLLTASGISFGHEMHLPRVHEMIGRHLDHVARRSLRMPIARTFPLEQASAAHEFMETAHPLGRVIINPL